MRQTHPGGGFSDRLAAYQKLNRTVTYINQKWTEIHQFPSASQLPDFMKRILTLCSLMAAFFLALANPVEFKTSIPKSGSTITSWDFELQFDITKALEAAAVDKPGVAVGLGVYSNNDDQITILYKGDPENNNILGTAFTSTINGKSDKFVVNGNTLKMSFNSDIPIEKGQKYTVVIKNDMALYIKDKATRVSSTLLRNSSNPIVLEFYGDDLNDSQLFVESCSLEDNENLESISEILLHFNSAFKISDGANVLIREGEKDLSSTTLLSVSPDNEKL